MRCIDVKIYYNKYIKQTTTSCPTFLLQLK